MSKIAIIKIHPGLNMALPQLAGDLKQAGHKTKLFFFKDYQPKKLYCESSSFSEVDNSVYLDDESQSSFGEDYQVLAEELRKFNPDVLGLSVITISIPEAIKTTQFLREHFDVPIIWGGVGVTLQPEIAIEHADMVCVGEGEEVIVEFANCMDNSTDWTTIAGTWARTAEGEVVKNPKRPLQNLDDIAIPDWEPTSLRYIVSNRVVKHKLAFQTLTLGDYQIMTQRGCPFSCSFCVESRYQEMFGKKSSLRRRSVELVIEELLIAKEKFNPRVLWFWDDVFTVNPRWLKEFLPEYKEKIGIPFWCYTYPTTHNLELLQDLKTAGCNCISMGIQSGSERILKNVYNRPTPLNRVIEASQEIIDAGLHGYFDLISKSAFETEADLRSTFEFLIDLPQEMVYGGIGEMKSYPTYAYTKNEESAKTENLVTNLGLVDDKLYDYYHKLYWVARNPFIDKWEKLEIGQEPVFRESPELLDQYCYGVRDVFQVIHEMRHVTEKGIHPNLLFPPPAYVHKPLLQRSRIV